MSKSETSTPRPPRKNEAVLIASGDLRLSANRMCWPAQRDMEKDLTEAFRREGWKLRRGHPYDAKKRHGFIDSQKFGMNVFRDIHPDSPLVVAESAWQYSHHILHGLLSHRGPILTAANWSGQWPGLVGMLNLNGSLTKAGVRYSSIWSKAFKDRFFLRGVRSWLQDGAIEHDTSHVHDARYFKLPEKETKIGRGLAQTLLRDKAIMGIFDEGCMGMFNAIIPDHLLNQTGVFKERLSQSALYAGMREVSDAEARGVYEWLIKKGMKFDIGKDPETDLTEDQILDQCRMYVSAVRIADDYGCDAIGIQYQQGLKDLAPASDLVEGLLNNVDRPPVRHAETGRVLFPKRAVTHFNEVDECAGLDGLITDRIWRALGQEPENTLHDLRYGEDYKLNGKSEFVWVFLISGAVPPNHFTGGYRGASSERQPPNYFPLGGGTLKGISKPGEIVWSRIFIDDNRLHCDIGTGTAVKLPDKETHRRWRLTTKQWPIMHAICHGISRDQMMARHKANHIQVAYTSNKAKARAALATKVAMLQELGVEVHICGTENGIVGGK